MHWSCLHQIEPSNTKPTSGSTALGCGEIGTTPVASLRIYLGNGSRFAAGAPSITIGAAVWRQFITPMRKHYKTSTKPTNVDSNEDISQWVRILSFAIGHIQSSSLQNHSLCVVILLGQLKLIINLIGRHSRNLLKSFEVLHIEGQDMGNAMNQHCCYKSSVMNLCTLYVVPCH